VPVPPAKSGQRLELYAPPRSVTVRVDDGHRRALLLAARGDRRFLQVSLGVGRNHLRWLDAALVQSEVAGS
jgi:hypothetical protein